MRVTFVLPAATLGGGTRVVAIHAQHLKRRGHRVVIVSTPRRAIRLRGRVKSLLTGRGWPGSTQPGPSHLDGIEVERRVLDRWRPVIDADVPEADVVVATWWETAEWVAALSPEKGAKAYFLQHYEIHEGQPIERVKATWSLPMHKMAISQWLVDLARQEYDDTNVSLVRNAVDANQFFAPPRGKQPVPTVGMLYRPVPWKGCDNSVAAYRQASRNIAGLRLRAFGGSKPTDSFFPPGTLFSYRPAQSTLRDIYAGCDVWLFGSLKEGFGLPILEAMACRTPVIGTPVGAAPELLREGGGILVRPNDPQDMARAIERVCTMGEDPWRAMSDAAHATATKYTWDDAAELFEEALHVAIDRSQRGELAAQAASHAGS